MYRSLGTLTAFGVPSGPYTGPPRRLRWSDLPREARDRLQAVIEGRARPAPIAIHIPRPTRLARRLALAAGLGVLALVALVVHSWPRAQPAGFVALYALAMAPIAALGVFLLHRRVVRGGAPIDPGKVLLPLDLVTFDGHALTVAPLGSVRDVGLVSETSGEGLRLVLRFESGEESAFPMPSVAHANRTYDALAHAQRTLEALSYNDDIEGALEHDPFFVMRTKGGFEGPRAATGPRRAPPLGVLVGLVGVAAIALGQVSYRATNRLSDDVRFRRAMTAGSDEAMHDYLARGGRRELEAQYFFASRRMNLRKDRELSEMRERVARNEGLRAATSGPDAAANPAGFSQPRSPAEWNLAHAQCLRAFTDRAPQPLKANSALPLLVAAADEARGGAGPAHLDVRFERTTSDEARAVVPAAPFDARERETARALAIILAEACPPAILDVRLARGPRLPQSRTPTLLVRYEVRRPSPRSIQGANVALAEVRFDVTLEVWPKKPVGFSLTMPPPEHAAETTRERSLFRIDDTTPLTARVQGALSARAFDRLYDELYAMFFRGAVKVPLPGFAEVERIFMK